MKKASKILMIMTMIPLLTTPALALEAKLSGFYSVRGIGDNFTAGNNYVGTLEDNAESESVIDQRLRMKLDALVNEYLSFTYYAELDMQWGDEQYSDAGRNDGGGIGGDTTNLETKNLHIDIKVPDISSAFRLGLQGFGDHYSSTFFDADMAGVKYTGKLGGVDLTAGWFKLVEGDFKTSDDVNLWALQAGFKPSDTFAFGADYYYYQNQGSQEYATFFGTADIQAVLNFNAGGGDWTANREGMALHYIGGHAEYHFGNFAVSGWLNTNFGTVDNINNNTATPALTEDLDVQGYAARVNLDSTLGDLKLRLGAAYFSGDDDLTDGDASFIVTPTATEGFAFYDDGFMIFTPDESWYSVGQYGFAMMDAAFAGYGLASIVLTGDYRPESMQNFRLRGGVGYFSSLEDKLAANDPRTDRAGTELGTEFFLRASYRFIENLDISLNGAYAFLGDFYDDHGGGTAVNTPTTDIDDPWETYVKVTLLF